MPAFEVGQEITFVNPNVGEPTTMEFRGQVGDMAVVFNRRSGWQGQIPLAWVTTQPTEPEAQRCDYCGQLQIECTCED
jgi:hypothetical protein